MNSVRKFSSAIVLLISLIFLTAFNAEANLLTAGDFEGISTIDAYWASSADVWGAENAALTGTVNGVTPFDSQMLQINHAGGGSVSQAHQIVAGSFTTGTTLSFDVQVNAFENLLYPGLAAQLYLTGGNGFPGTAVGLVLGSALTLDSDVSTWESLSVSHILTTNYDHLL